MRVLFLSIQMFLPHMLISQQNQQILTEIEKNLDRHEALYEHFHQYPELSFSEFNTAQLLSQELGELGYKITRNVGGNGFVGILTNGKGPVIMLRTDMDALPVTEKTGLPFSSEIPGVMHACGHDMHMTVWLGTAKIMAAMKDSWSGTLMMVAQQAEEKSGGANAMIEDGLFTRFYVPDYALAYHVNPELQAGKIGYRPGPFMAGVNSVNITVYGVGGHGAMPHTTIDPIVLASRMVLAFQTITSREISPLKPAVVTVGSIHGGMVNNIIPDEVKMQLTVRFFEDDVYTQIIESMKRISAGIAQSAGLKESQYPEIIPTDQLTPPVINDEALTMKAVGSFTSVLGESNIVKADPYTVGEDFARYGKTPEKVPIAMFWLGAVSQQNFQAWQNEHVQLPGLHSPEFCPDFEPTYRTGVAAMSKALLDLFNE